MLTEKNARALGKRIAKESSAVVKFGRTNGRICLHLRFSAKPAAGDKIGSEREAKSLTIYSEAEWQEVPFPYNESKRPRKSRDETDRDIAAAVANKEAA